MLIMSKKPPSSNFSNQNYNPCIEESDLVNKCLDTNLYDYSKCFYYFENYRRCKKFWGYIGQKRKFAGIKPTIPEKEERDKILKSRAEGINIFSASE